MESISERNLTRPRANRASPLTHNALEAATVAEQSGTRLSAFQREDGVLFLVTLEETQPGVFTEIARQRV